MKKIYEIMMMIMVVFCFITAPMAMGTQGTTQGLFAGLAGMFTVEAIVFVAMVLFTLFILAIMLAMFKTLKKIQPQMELATGFENFTGNDEGEDEESTGDDKTLTKAVLAKKSITGLTKRATGWFKTAGRQKNAGKRPLIIKRSETDAEIVTRFRH